MSATATTDTLKKWTQEEEKVLFDSASKLDLKPTDVISLAAQSLPERTLKAVGDRYYSHTQYLVPGRRIDEVVSTTDKQKVWTPINVEMLKRLISDPQYKGKSQSELAVIAAPLFKEAGITTTAIAKKISKIKLEKKSKKKNGKAVKVVNAVKLDAVRAIVKWKGREDAIIKKAHKQNPNVSQAQLTKLVTTELPGRSPSAIQSRVSMLLRSKTNVAVEKPTATKQTVPAANHAASNSMGLTLPFEVKNIVFRGGNAIEINGKESDNGLVSVSINEDHNCLTIKTGGKIAYVSISAPGEAVVKF